MNTMSEPTLFEICFPTHVTGTPVCKPGDTVAGVVVLKLNSPMAASHLHLKFCGVERVRRTPVATARMEVTEKRQQLTVMSQTMVMDKEFFRRELILWGTPRVGSTRIIPCDQAHRFHFSFTMPHVNMPTPRQTPDIEISYFFEASLFTEVFDQQRGGNVLKDVRKTGIKAFRFEPVVQAPVVTHALSAAPLETVVPMVDAAAAAAAAASGGTQPTSSDPRISSILPFQSSSNSGPKVYMNLHVFNSTPTYLPGETVELLILAPAGKKITSATAQLRENIRCRKSSAPIIDESEVPILWRCSVDLSMPQELEFNKLTKTSITQDIGLLGRYLFTNSTTTSPTQPDSEVVPQSQQQHQSGFSRMVSRSKANRDAVQSIDVSRSSADTVPTSPVTTTAGMSIADSNSTASHQQQQQQQQHQLGGMLQSPGVVPLSPLTEAQELPGGANGNNNDSNNNSINNSNNNNGSSDTLENGRRSMSGSTTSLDSATHMHLGGGGGSQQQPNAHTVGRSRTPSMGTAARQQQQSMYQQCFSPTQAAANPSALSSIMPRKLQKQQHGGNGGDIDSEAAASSAHYQQQPNGNMAPSPLTNNSNNGSSNHYGGGQISKSNNRLSRNLSSEMDDSVSEKSSVSDTLSIRYQPTKATASSLASNYISFARNNSTYSSLLPAKYANRLSSATPVAIGGLLAKGSYRFAKVQFTLPSMADMSPVSSVFLDYEYSVDIAMSIGGSFGTTKKASGKLPLKIVTSRRQMAPPPKYRANSNAIGMGRDSSGGSSSGSSQVLADGMDNSTAQSLGDSLSCLNLSIAQAEETNAIKGSPTNTLTNFRFDASSQGNGGGGAKQEETINYPCLLSFLENGEKVPMPILESVNIGSNIM
ncbi:hypothetical protein IW140_002908 [Coemansia sp. RSA 1813]|nr:hypothetical protein IW140_002908 [Coemansia sp. RSA 1813]